MGSVQHGQSHEEKTQSQGSGNTKKGSARSIWTPLPVGAHPLQVDRPFQHDPGVFMASLDGSIVMISLPAIFHGIGINPLSPHETNYMLWTLMGYMVVTATLLVAFGPPLGPITLVDGAAGEGNSVCLQGGHPGIESGTTPIRVAERHGTYRTDCALSRHTSFRPQILCNPRDG